MNRLFTWLDSKREYTVFDRPVFILSAPRSGSTFLFELLRQFEEAWAFKVETDHIWKTIFPKERLREPSDYVGTEDASPDKKRALRRSLYRLALWTREREGRHVTLAQRLARQPVRYVEKAIANCFHLEFIEEAFPDALYIMLLRHPCPTISSMLVGFKGSKRSKFGRDVDPAVANFSPDIFSYPRPPGWTNSMQERNEGEAYAWAWSQYVTTALLFLQRISPTRRLTVRYESLVNNTGDEAERIASFCDLNLCDTVRRFTTTKPLSRTTLTAPDDAKWRELHGPLLDRLAPIYREAMNLAGYAKIAPMAICESSTTRMQPNA